MGSNSSRLACLVFLALALNFPVSNAFKSDVRVRGNAAKCLTKFQNDPRNFSACTSQPCFLFLQEEPYVDVDPAMTSESHQVLFPCHAPTSIFSGMKGTVFAIHNATSAKDALCVWGGPECTFNDMTAFLTLRSGTHKKHQFGITGLLLESPARVTKELYPSSSIVDSRLVIVGPLNSLDGRSDPFKILLSPFRNGTWYLFWSMIALFLVFGIVIVLVFTPNDFSWETIFFHLMGEPVEEGPNAATTPNASADPSQSTATTGSSWRQATNFFRRRRDTVRDSISDRWINDDVQSTEEDDDSNSKVARYRAALWLFRVSITMFVVIFILFYEIAVVNFMFNQNNIPQALNIERLSQDELSRYTILKSSGIEDIWRQIADPYGTYNSSTLPWDRCANSTDCFDKILDPSHRAKFTVTFDNFANYEMIKRRICHKLAIYSTDRRLYSFGAGWLYGEGIPLLKRIQIDNDIQELRVTDEMRTLLKSGKQKILTCSDRPINIHVALVGVTLLVLVGPGLFFLTVILGVASFQRRSRSA